MFPDRRFLMNCSYGANWEFPVGFKFCHEYVLKLLKYTWSVKILEIINIISKVYVAEGKLSLSWESWSDWLALIS